jgi:hypothetical protein
MLLPLLLPLLHVDVCTFSGIATGSKDSCLLLLLSFFLLAPSLLPPPLLLQPPPLLLLVLRPPAAACWNAARAAFSGTILTGFLAEPVLSTPCEPAATATLLGSCSLTPKGPAKGGSAAAAAPGWCPPLMYRAHAAPLLQLQLLLLLPLGRHSVLLAASESGDTPAVRRPAMGDPTTPAQICTGLLPAAVSKEGGGAQGTQHTEKQALMASGKKSLQEPCSGVEACTEPKLRLEGGSKQAA